MKAKVIIVSTFFLLNAHLQLVAGFVELVGSNTNQTIIHHVQRVDHFSFSNNDVFHQRLVISTTDWGKNGWPIFFYTGNEGDIMVFANNTGLIWEISPIFKAMVVFAEHRYYGQSLPYGNESFQTVDKMGYLTTEQALADFSVNIERIKMDYQAPDSPVIVFGGSYGGMLAAWFRMKYPHLAIGALAASAPIYQFPGIYNCSGYYQVVTKDFAGYSQSCADNIRKSWPILRKMARTDDGRIFLNNLFNICPNDRLKVESDVEQLKSYIENAYTSMAMTDYPNSAEFLQPLPPYPIRESCRFLKGDLPNDDHLLMSAVYMAVSVFYNFTGQVSCTSFSPNEMDRGWSIQACTEMVMPICADGVTDMFEPSTFDLADYEKDCLKKYGLRPQPTLAVREWGGRDIMSATNIIFSNGDRDPWSVGGVLELPKGASSSLHVLNIPHACHHEDLRATGQNDTVYLLATREKEKEIISQWLREHRSRNGLSGRFDGHDGY